MNLTAAISNNDTAAMFLLQLSYKPIVFITNTREPNPSFALQN
jgi:hypothetical protein